MGKLLVALCLLVLASAATAVPLAEKDKALLAGDWRVGSECPAYPDKTTAWFTLEFAVTGGEIQIDDPGVQRRMGIVESADASGTELTLAFQDKTRWTFHRSGKDVLVSEAPPAEFAGLKGAAFRRCRGPADRSALKLEPDAIAFFSTMMPPDFAMFYDAHSKQGCKPEGSYVSINFVGPERFAITRGTLKLGSKGGPSQPQDSKTWSIDAADELPGVVRLTITELLGPDHTRGAAGRISLVSDGESNLLTIPEWDGVYRRCSIHDMH
ncbi:MAG TPA: hypothetical protein VGG48_13170 [Rhizomicrobium sp.]|jgi:hypothetical protein